MKTANLIFYFLLAPFLLVSMTAAHSDEEHDSEKSTSHRHTVVNNILYKEECGSCHMAYPPGLLPSAAWQKVMTSLSDHFGDNAELDTAKRKEITQYLQNNSAEDSRSRRMPDPQAIRITQQPFFIHEHDEIPARLITANPKVKSFSNCAACHQRAEQSSFKEREINIPGYGPWED